MVTFSSCMNRKNGSHDSESSLPPSAGTTVFLSHSSTLRVCDSTVSPSLSSHYRLAFFSAVFHRCEIIRQRNHFEAYPTTARGRTGCRARLHTFLFLPRVEQMMHAYMSPRSRSSSHRMHDRSFISSHCLLSAPCHATSKSLSSFFLHFSATSLEGSKSQLSVF